MHDTRAIDADRRIRPTRTDAPARATAPRTRPSARAAAPRTGRRLPAAGRSRADSLSRLAVPTGAVRHRVAVPAGAGTVRHHVVTPVGAVATPAGGLAARRPRAAVPDRSRVAARHR
ncbi:hypothetical protein GA0070611_1955 [Micromonospora auratinigra]|uniref:Uncharacterized protein n=1 Tax=Micromonospora auratinigra TaxID=261654 RepID=A0A1A8ZEQ8_9ACTN|nr:hypothetical protein GA0070611_1955 [Micromonospora auratinigra]